MLHQQYTKIRVPQKHFWENFKIIDYKYRFWILKITLFLTDIGYLVKLLINHSETLSPKNLENISIFDNKCISPEKEYEILFFHVSFVVECTFTWYLMWMTCHIDFKCCSINFHKQRKSEAKYQYLGTATLRIFS